MSEETEQFKAIGTKPWTNSIGEVFTFDKDAMDVYYAKLHYCTDLDDKILLREPIIEIISTVSLCASDNFVNLIDEMDGPIARSDMYYYWIYTEVAKDRGSILAIVSEKIEEIMNKYKTK